MQADLLTQQAERIRDSGILGRSSLTQRLFDFLVDCALRGKVPKEIEVAIDAFGRGADFDVSQDAVVRVYIHKLRRKLDEHYADAGKDQPHRIVIPRGEYRLTTAAQTAPVAAAPTAPMPAPGETLLRPWWRWGAVALAVSLVLNLILVLSGPLGVGRTPDPLEAVREDSIWAPLLADDLPIYLVVGDYYIFGEVDEFLFVDRLVRDFSINSRADFDRALQSDPEFSEHYQDLNLAYLPTSSAFALRDVVPVLAPAHRRLRVIQASDLNADILKSGHIVYIGYFSGLGTLREIVFAGSRFQTGESFDELIDTTTKTHYVSDVGGPIEGKLKYRDYGYVSTFPGPSRTRVIIIAGTRDTAVMRAAEIATQKQSLDEIEEKAGTSAFEALYEVYGFDRTDIDASLLVSAPLATAGIWREQP